MQTDTTNKLIEATFKISRAMKDSMCYTSSITQLSLVQLQALIFIKKNPNVPMRKIAEHFRIELPSATSLLNKLSTMKLVERHTDPDDRRIVRINLTTDGQTLLKNAMIERAKKMEKLLSFLPEEDKSTLLRIVTTLTEKMEEQNEK
jgi:DNA-binding MarR family transcriptional regulator